MDGVPGVVQPATAAPSSPLRMLQEGKLECITVDPTKLLYRIIDAIGGDPPVCTETICGAEGVKLTITVDFKLGQERSFVEFEGGPSICKEEVEKEVILKALRHLDQVFKISLVDYSCRVASTFGSYKTFLLLKESHGSVDQLLFSFEKVLLKCKELADEFESNEVNLIISGEISNSSALSRDTSRFLEAVVRRCSMKAEEARAKLTSVKSYIDDHQNRIAERARVTASKGPSNRVVLSAKYLLDYVLSYFGFAKATYRNSPAGHGIVEGYAMFSLPYIPIYKFGGNMTLKGTGDSSLTAEEDAAFQSLLMIEDNYNLQIVDLRHSHRLNVEKVIKDQVCRTGHMLEVGDSVKDAWQNMIKDLEEYREHLSYSLSSLVIGGIRKHEIPYFEECINSLKKLEEDSVKTGYDFSQEMFCVIEEITSKCEALKIKLDII